MSLTSRKFIILKRIVEKILLPASNLIFLVVLLGLPFLYRFKYNTSVQEHGYLNRYSMNEVVQSEFDLMYKTKDYLLSESSFKHLEEKEHIRDNHYNYYTNKNNYTDYQQDFKKTETDSAYSYWSDVRFEDTPEIYVKIAHTLKDIKNIQVSYNRFKYTFPTKGKNSEIYGQNLLFRVNCLRCLARGATLLVATINTDNYKDDVTSVVLSLTAIKHLSNAQYLSQNIFLLVTMKQLPFAVGTRQFLHDYFNSHYFKHRSGTLHNALVVDLGTNTCSSFLISYEGIDGHLPNQDIVNIFVEISEVEGMTVHTRGLWPSIFRMAVNVDRLRHHVPLLEKNINGFSIMCKATSKFEQTVNYNLELLLKSVVLTLRNQNNLHTMLERSFNFYFFVRPTSFVSISIYSLVVPLLFIRQLVMMSFHPYLDNIKMILGIVLVFLNIALASTPAYLFLLRLVRNNSGNTVDLSLLNEVRKSLGLLVLSYTLVFVVNHAFYLNFQHKFGDQYLGEKSLMREELVSKMRKLSKTYQPKPLTRLLEKLKKMRRRFVKKWLRMGKKSKTPKRQRSVDSTFSRSDSADTDSSTRRDLELRENMERLRVMSDSMGPYWYISRVPSRLPRVDVFLLLSIYFLGIAFSLGLSVLNWALCFLLTIFILLPFNVMSVHNNSRLRNIVCLVYFVVLLLLFYPFEGWMGSVRSGAFHLLKNLSYALEMLFEINYLKRYEMCEELGEKFAFLKDYVFGSKTQWINSTGNRFLLRKIYSATENHLLFGSYNIVILLFLFGIIAHMMFLNVVSLFIKKTKTKTE
ncbi:hypothetical protein MACK_002088 [Theileria orientalis]|uniref:Glycosylphosphatidylinositol anchor attachment 1 protein n=1 Tax=Theileria orientalis TaxID=68886 RepID=A0A976MD92_THEOR|nr:hypothetical protein MACK_002088 [Theileria orientalis]